MSSGAYEVIVVTGASGGIGRAVARAFARPGVRIALLARGISGLAGARQEVEERGAETLVIPTDVGDHVMVQAAVKQIVALWGRIDVWVNNAMLTVFGPANDLAADELRRVTDVSYLGAAYCTMAALTVMRGQNHGTIVQVGSALAYRAIPLQSAYCGAKHALRGFTDAVRCELLHDRSSVHITSVHLSAFNTPQFDWARNLMGRRAQPVPPIFQPELAAAAIVWAARHRRREVFVGWPAVKAVMANKLIPGFLDRYLAKNGYEGQLTPGSLPPDPCENLYRPCDTNPGAHGRFDARAKSWSWQWWVTAHRGTVLTVVVVLSIIGSVVVFGQL